MRPRLYFAFLGLCLLSATRGAVTTLLPSPLPGPLQQTLHFAAITILCALPSVLRLKQNFSVRLLPPLFFFFPLPVILTILADGHLNSYLQVVVFALLPAVIVLATAAQTTAFGPEVGSRRLLIPALAGAAGSLLLLPLSLPTSNVSRVLLAMLVAAGIAAALSAIRLHALLASREVLPVAAIVGLMSTGLLAVVSYAGIAAYPLGLTFYSLFPDAIQTFLFDGPILLLTLWLLREMSPIPFASRYLLIPLVAILEALVLLRPQATPYLVGGLILMSASGVWLLLAKSPETT